MSDDHSQGDEDERGDLTGPSRSPGAAVPFLTGTAADPRERSASPAVSDGPGGPGSLENLGAYVEDPGVFEERREPTHATATVPYESVAGALAADERFAPLEERFDRSPYFELLDGEWDFRFYERPDDLPDSFDDEGWDTITVPSVWQTEGYDQTLYANTPITWEKFDPPLSGNLDPRDGPIEVPATNPTGVYRREFTVPGDWDGRQVFLHFEGVKQAYFVWIDGEYVGFQQGSKTPGEFDVTEHVAAGGAHEVTVRVHRFSDGEALETLDMFRYSGIFRSVYLFSTPRVHVRDFFVRTEFDDEYGDATLRVDVELANYDGTSTGGHEVRGRLFGPDDGDAVATPAPAGSGGEEVATFAGSADVGPDGAHLAIETVVEDPAKWSAEYPTLYGLVLELLPPAGEPTEVLYEKVGFREYETTRGERGAQVLVNGQPVEIRGTNRHETDPETGRAIRHETVRRDFETLKRFDLNAVRTSHYPNDPTFLRLADEYGIYVQDEVNAETHWWEQLAAETEAYHEQFVARFRRMVLRDRNHPSVFSWSTGNEAGTGAEHLEMAALVLDSDETLPREVNGERYDGPVWGLDPTRLLYHQPNGGGWTIDYGDMLGPRYPDVDQLLSVADGSSLGDSLRPVVMGEYNHAMGNSLGLVDAMWSEHIQPPARRAPDASGNGNDGVLVGSPTVEPDPEGDGGAVVLEGPGDGIELLDPSDLDFATPGFAIEVRFGALAADDDVPLFVRDGAYALEASGGELSFTVAGTDEDVTVSASLPDDGWHTVIAVCATDALALSIDGEEVATTAHSIRALDGSGGPVLVGGDPESGDTTGVTVGAVRVYDRALTTAEVGAGVAESPSDAVLQYDFEELLRDQSLVGGFVWDWVNQDLNATTTVDGEAVDYQFYDDDPFCLNGLVWSDRTPQPELWQLKHCHQPVGVADADVSSGEVYVTNHHAFTDLSELDVAWELSADDEVLQSGALDLSISPGETRRVTVPFDEPPELVPGTEYWLDLSFALPDATPYADAGHEVAFEQLAVPFDVPEPPAADVDAMPPVSVTESGDAVVVSGDEFEYTFDRAAGTLSSFRHRGAELVERGPLLDAWRAPIMNEAQSWGGEQASSWYEAGLDALEQEVESVTVDRTAESVATIEIDGFLAGAELGPLLRTPDAARDNVADTHGECTVVDGASGRALAFDGQSHLTLEVPDAPDLHDGLTLECWIRPGEPREGAADQPYLIAGGQYLLKRRSADRGGDLEFAVYSDGWRTVAADAPEDWADGWHHLAGVWNPGAAEFALYVDGERRGTTDFGGSLGDFDGRIRVGGARDSYVADGTAIDEIRVYARGLADDEVGSLDAPPGGALARLPLDEFETVERDVPGFRARYRYRVFGNGAVALAVDAAPNDQLRRTIDDYLPKVGVALELPRSFDDFEWYGRGPQETYPDRKTGVRVGRYEGSVAEQYVPYLPPTDNGNKAETRWAALSDGEVGLLGAAGDAHLNVGVDGWTNLDGAAHTWELEERDTVALHLDHAVSGVGGTPVQLPEEHQVKPVPVSFEVVLRPFAAGDDPAALAAERLPGPGPD